MLWLWFAFFLEVVAVGPLFVVAGVFVIGFVVLVCVAFVVVVDVVVMVIC